MNPAEARALTSPEIRQATDVERLEREVTDAFAELEQTMADEKALDQDPETVRIRALYGAIFDRRNAAKVRLGEASQSLMQALQRRGRS